MIAAANILILVVLFIPKWTLQTSGVTARLRGVSAVNTKVIWASGSDSTVLRTSNGGVTWQKLTVTSEKLDFRDIDAIDERTAFVLSIGNGQASRIYKTTDAGISWKLQFQNTEEKAFYDAMSFWDRDHGLVVGDSINGQFCVLQTNDAGGHWTRVPKANLPVALENEGAFAASGTNIAMVGKTHAWIGFGAAGRARVLRTSDGGRTWKVADTPIIAGPSAGIFSIAFQDAKHGVVVGGDYRKENDGKDNLAFTNDGGSTWTLGKGLSGFRSVVAYVSIFSGEPSALIAIGPSGADFSVDNGKSWGPVTGRGFDTISLLIHSHEGWAAGADGGIGRLTF